MSTFAELVYIANETKSKICFFMEFKNFRRRYLIFENFNTKTNSWKNVCCLHRFFFIPELYCLQFKRRIKKFANYSRIYKSKVFNFFDSIFFRGVLKLFYSDFIKIYGNNDVHCDEELLALDNRKNYDIRAGFGTYSDWKKYEEIIISMFDFSDMIKEIGNTIYSNIYSNKETVGIHFRRGDYLIMSSLNLSLAYYKKALTYFDKSHYKLVIFSDDIEYCKNTEIFEGYDCYYMDAHSSGVDMYIMSLCNHNIIANSSFSFWGAFLNKHENQKVVCPHDFIGQSDKDHLYMNGNWYPDSWISLNIN